MSWSWTHKAHIKICRSTIYAPCTFTFFFHNPNMHFIRSKARSVYVYINCFIVRAFAGHWVLPICQYMKYGCRPSVSTASPCRDRKFSKKFLTNIVQKVGLWQNDPSVLVLDLLIGLSISQNKIQGRKSANNDDKFQQLPRSKTSIRLKSRLGTSHAIRHHREQSFAVLTGSADSGKNKTNAYLVISSPCISTTAPPAQQKQQKIGHIITILSSHQPQSISQKHFYPQKIRSLPLIFPMVADSRMDFVRRCEKCRITACGLRQPLSRSKLSPPLNPTTIG